MNFISAHQLDYLLVLANICFLISIFTLILKFDNAKTKYSLLAIELCTFILVMADRYSYIFRGNESTLGYWMVRISNFLVFNSQLAETLFFAIYILSVLKLEKIPKRFWVIIGFLALGFVVLFISQFTGWYYTFDSTNHYKRSNGFPICYLFPIVTLSILSSLIFEYCNRISVRIRFSIIAFPILLFVSGVIQLFVYGISLNTLCYAVLAVILFICAIYEVNGNLDHAREKEIILLKEQAKNMQDLFAQTASALSGAIDAKDKYTHGHSVRVAEYSRKMAEMAGMTENECNEIYFAGLLHDVGKIGIPDEIINKTSKLTTEEFDEIKKHPSTGDEILKSINKLPYLSIGAHYHHERYDGKGYPSKLKATDIPEFARIIAVADAYDAMTSKRSYREPMSQLKVREEIVKGIGTQFDPKYARLMIHMIDLDTGYKMKENNEVSELAGLKHMESRCLRKECSDGILIDKNKVTVRMCCKAIDKEKQFFPALVLFDSLDSRIHEDEREKKDLTYSEYVEIKPDGENKPADIRNIEIIREKIEDSMNLKEYDFEIEAVKQKDHILLTMKVYSETNIKPVDSIVATIALSDSTRYAYISLTGENCAISEIELERDAEEYSEKIKRIAEEICLFECPEGDVPSVQVDSYRSAHSNGILIDKSKKVRFHMKSLSFARLVWHCPFILIFDSDNGKVYGPNYNEYELIRLDGEGWPYNTSISNVLQLSFTETFHGWDEWKELNKAGRDVELSLIREEKTLTLFIDVGGVFIKDTITFNEPVRNLYISFTGDECIVENIRYDKN